MEKPKSKRRLQYQKDLLYLNEFSRFCSTKLLLHYQYQYFKANKQVSMIRKYHKHTPQIKPRPYEEEPQQPDCHKTSGRQLKQSKQFYLPNQPLTDTFSWGYSRGWLVWYC